MHRHLVKVQYNWLKDQKEGRIRAGDIGTFVNKVDYATVQKEPHNTPAIETAKRILKENFANKELTEVQHIVVEEHPEPAPTTYMFTPQELDYESI